MCSPRSSASTSAETLRQTDAASTVSPAPASASSRAARLTASPVTVYFGVAPPSSTAATTSPLAMPTCSASARRDAGSASCAAAACIASAARSARSGSLPWAIGAPKTASTPSPAWSMTLPP